MSLDNENGCRCPSCLAKAISTKLEKYIDETELALVLKTAQSYSNQDKLVEHIDYKKEDGKQIFTRWYLLKQGQCCDNGCRNCPF